MKLNLESKTSSEERVKAYLEENVSETLSRKINNGVYIEKDGKRLLNKKTLQGFIKYATEEAQKEAEKGSRSAFISDDTVFGWAIHYFEEDSIEEQLFNEDGSAYKKPVPKPKTSRKSTYTATSAPIIKKQEPQVSLFDMMTVEENKEKEPEKEKPTLDEILDYNIDDEHDDDKEDSEEFTEEEIAEAFEEQAEMKPVKQEVKGSAFYESYKSYANKYPDCIVCYRMGDFYEILGKKAALVADCLNLTLVSRDCGLEQRVPMCGFPYHVVDIYIKKIISAGYKVALIDTLTQTEKAERVIEKTKTIPDDKPIIDLSTGEILSTNKIANDLSSLFGNNIVEVD